jgi:NADH:ubiquinone oxidoreductase subunit C
MADDEAREDDPERGDAPAEEAGAAAAVPVDEVAAAVVERFPGVVFRESLGQPVVYVTRSDWRSVAAFLHDEQQFTMLLDVCAVDHLVAPERVRVDGVEPERFEVVANLLSHPRNRRMRMISEVPAGDPSIDSLAPVFAGASAPERETYDLFGVTFNGHPDLTRILMPDDWVGFPLRKDDAPGAVPVRFKGDPAPR